MPSVRKVLGRSNPAASTETTLYTPGAGVSAIVSLLTITNKGSGTFKARVAVTTQAAATATDWVAYDVPVPPGEQIEMLKGACLRNADADKVRVWADSVDAVFVLFGQEDT